MIKTLLTLSLKTANNHHIVICQHNINNLITVLT